MSGPGRLSAWFAACRAEATAWPRWLMLGISAVRSLAALLVVFEFVPVHHPQAPWFAGMLVGGFAYTLVILLLDALPGGGRQYRVWWGAPFLEATLIGLMILAAPPDAPFRWLILVHVLGCGVLYGTRFTFPVIVQHTVQLLVLDTLVPPRYPVSDMLLVLLIFTFQRVFSYVQRSQAETQRLTALELARVHELEALSKAKLQFINIASHELRTPLTVIKGYARLLETLTPAEAPSMTEFVQSIRKASDRMTLLIDEFLDFGRLSSGQLKLACEHFDVATLLADIAKVLEVLAQGRQQRLEVQTEPGLEKLWGDPRRLEQVVLNLAHNALKYSAPGATVVLSASRGPEGWSLAVRDPGPGIAPRHLDHLFTPFFRAGAEHTGVEGIGLGLAISRGIVEAHGGTLVYERTGGWTTFRADLPGSASVAEQVVALQA